MEATPRVAERSIVRIHRVDRESEHRLVQAYRSLETTNSTPSTRNDSEQDPPKRAVGLIPMQEALR